MISLPWTAASVLPEGHAAAKAKTGAADGEGGDVANVMKVFVVLLSQSVPLRSSCFLRVSLMVIETRYTATMMMMVIYSCS